MSNINEILSKNLSYIKQYDTDLALKIEAIEFLTQSIEMIYTDLNEPNLALNGIPINEQTGAQAEAERIVNSLTNNNKASMHIVFGTGFGYLFKLTAESSNGTTILYEPNIELLRVALEMVDFSDILCKKNVFICSNFQMLQKHFSNSFLSNSKTSLLASYYHKTYLKNELEKLVQDLGLLFGILKSNATQRAEHGYTYTFCTLANANELSTSTYLSELKDSLKNIPAIIAAAGPSLTENLDTLKKYRKKFVLFGVSSSLATLTKNNIIPDFISNIEKFDSCGIIKDCPLEKINLITEPYVNNTILKLPFRNKFISSSIENSANRIYEKLFPTIKPDYFETKGTVAYNALFAAKYLGCNPIILAGQDLAYIDGECYSKGSPLNTIKCRKNCNDWEIYIENEQELKEKLFGHRTLSEHEKNTEIKKRINELNKQLIVIKDVHGREIATSKAFAMFAEYYKSFAENYAKDVDLYNLSQKGAYIGNFKYKNLELLLKDRPDANYSIGDFSMQKYPINKPFIETEIEHITNAITNIQENKAVFDSLEQDLKDSNFNEQTIHKIKNILNNFAKTHSKFMEQSMLYREITHETQYTTTAIFSELNEINLESAQKIHSILKVFYEKDLGRLIYIKDMLISKIRNL